MNTFKPSSPLVAVGNETMPQLALLDVFFPGFSMFTGAMQRYLGINLNIYIPLIAVLGGLIATWRELTPTSPFIAYVSSRDRVRYSPRKTFGMGFLL